MPNLDLQRFKAAQAAVREQVDAELKAGRKTTHWMWFVFPQLAGLGRSEIALHYAINDLEQARQYLADPVLGKQLRSDVRSMLAHKGRSATQILGSPDDLKFRSCATLFHAAAGSATDRDLFQMALHQFYDGLPDQRTMSLLHQPGA